MESESPDWETMSSEDLSDWLKSRGIPMEFCLKFEGGFSCNLLL